MYKSLSAKCYQEHKEGLQKKLVKDTKISSKKKKKAWERSERYGFERYKNLSEEKKKKKKKKKKSLRETSKHF